MKEKHFAYKITHSSVGLVCTHSEIEENRMVDLLKEIKNDDSQAIFWIFKQFDNQPKEQLCIIDGPHHRIYYHYSGEVEGLDEAIEKLSKKA
ncbi:hypothetical protein EP47_06760 [Legionella norrlandica]|uniref:Uncharacterized protein n=1 Tax=Legionella norrlandica TaxID=1498499 RepID=A0A0A2SUP5_9GAMM|nr:hypothetical protein [Legionella norrlandica]KGP63174.1 hypothetical protein EP47_06760 [Legionella norrlandica]